MLSSKVLSSLVGAGVLGARQGQNSQCRLLRTTSHTAAKKNGPRWFYERRRLDGPKSSGRVGCSLPFVERGVRPRRPRPARPPVCLSARVPSVFLPPSAFGLLRSRTVAARREHRCAKPSLPSLPFPSLTFPFLFPAPAFPRQPALEEGGRAKAEGARRKAENQGGKGKRGHPAPHQHSNTSPRAHCTSAAPPLHLPDIDPFTTQLNNTTNTNHTHTVCRSARL